MKTFNKISNIKEYNQYVEKNYPNQIQLFFQSYSSMIVKIDRNYDKAFSHNQVFLDQKYWNYSNTTGKYRNIFLNETIKDTRKKIKSGEYKLTDLNGGYNDNR